VIGKKIRELRKNAGLSRRELAHLIESSETALVNVENGIENFGEECITKIAKVLNIDPMILFKIKKNHVKAKPENIQIGKNIKKLRKKWGMTQEDLAEKLGYKSSGAICTIEKGTRGISRTQLFKLCDIFKVDIMEITQPVIERDQLMDDFLFLYYTDRKSELFRIISNLIHIAAEKKRS
ncbi:helix-turn-helix domain-containing protein, partial [Desulfamplus magnetovallimortis]|uniref:helix-turn-helix domain-containing protein n=1 Tax=Desulfamplus magnetovallimortis TaxID=1246637 RepID=UPI001648942C